MGAIPPLVPVYPGAFAVPLLFYLVPRNLRQTNLGIVSEVALQLCLWLPPFMYRRITEPADPKHWGLHLFVASPLLGKLEREVAKK
jgi:hypothetical protein